MNNAADLAQPARVCLCFPQRALHCLLHPLTPHGCRHLDILLGLRDVTYDELVARLPPLQIEDICWRYRAHATGEGKALERDVKTAGGVTPVWMVLTTARLGQMETIAHIEGGLN